MEAFLPLLKNVLLFVVLAIPGYILVKTKQLKQEQSGVLSKILMYVGLPFMILANTLSVSFNLETIISLLTVAAFGIAFNFIFFFMSGALAVKPTDEQKAKTRGMMRFSEVFSNTGFLGIPLVAAVFGAGSIIVSYMVILNIITNVMMYTLGTYLVSGDKKSINVKGVILNPVIIAFAAGIILNLLSVKTYIPEVGTYADHFKNVVTPLAMTVLGMKMGGIKFVELFKSKTMYYVSAVKLVLFPIIATVITILVQKIINVDANNVIISVLIAFATPTAGLASAFADRYNSDSDSAAIFTLGTTLLSIIAIPLLYMILCLVL